MKDMAIVGVAGEGFCTDHQAFLVRDRNAGLNAEFVRLARPDAFDFRCMQCVAFAAQFLAFLGVTLLQGDAAAFGRLYDFATRNFQQATSTGCAIAFSWTVVSTMTRSKSAGLTTFACTAASVCSTPVR